MSTVPPLPQASSGVPPWVKWLLGLTAGCFLLVIACCVGTCLFGRAMFGDVMQKLQGAEQEQALSRAALDRLEIVDMEFPPRLPADGAEAALTDDDVSRYVRIRGALQPHAAKYQGVVDGALPTGEGTFGVLRGVAGFIGAALDATAARRELLAAAEPALRAEGVGPADLSRMTEIVEWRFLRRPEATFLGLPEDERRGYQQMLLEERALTAWTGADMSSQMRVNGRSREDAERDLARLREEIAALQERARQRTALPASTLVLLEARRAELEALPPVGLEAIAPLTAEPPLISFLESDGISVHRREEWGSAPETEEVPPPVDETLPAPIPAPVTP